MFLRCVVRIKAKLKTKQLQDDENKNNYKMKIPMLTNEDNPDNKIAFLLFSNYLNLPIILLKYK